MTLFSFTVQDDFSGDQEFLIEADDLIEAHIKALDFAKILEEKIRAKCDVDANCEIVHVSKVSAKHANDAGAAEYVEQFNTDYVDHED